MEHLANKLFCCVFTLALQKKNIYIRLFHPGTITQHILYVNFMKFLLADVWTIRKMKKLIKKRVWISRGHSAAQNVTGANRRTRIWGWIILLFQPPLPQSGRQWARNRPQLYRSTPVHLFISISSLRVVLIQFILNQMYTLMKLL